MLVTGPWYSTISPYSVLFDDVSVPATLIQRGVLRCYTPGKPEQALVHVDLLGELIG